MNRSIIVAGVFAFAGLAQAQPTNKPSSSAKPATETKPNTPTTAAEMPPPTPPKPGAETEALKPFAKSMSWTGKVPAGAYGPGSPEMPSKGKMTCKWTLDNLFAACDIDETIGTGKMSMHWKGHETFGWDFAEKGYRMVMADTMGEMGELKGTLENNKLSWESAKEHLMNGQPSKFRVSFDNSDPKAMKFVSEHTVGGKWVVDEEATMKVGK